MEPRRFLLDGIWTSGSETADVVNPYTGSVADAVCLADPAHIGQAVNAAARAFAETRRIPAGERSRTLRRIAEALAAREDEFVETIVGEAGKPASLARAEVQRARATFEVAASEALVERGHVLAMEATFAGAGHTGLVRRFPLGVILGITPFNFPLNLVAHKVAPCIATGNTMILKPALKTPLTALLLAQVFQQCDVPNSQVTFLPFHHDHVRPLLADGRIRMLSFTGSADVGWALKQAAARQRVTLELGGNAAVIVEADADWERHVAKIATGAFAFAGQSCISVQRIYVHETLYAAFREAFLTHVADRVVVGDPRDQRTLVGPMITRGALERITGWVEQARARGARLLTPWKTGGQVLHPVVLEDVPPGEPVSCEEAFAPVAVLEPYRDLAGAIATVNRSRFGLQAGVFTRDLGRADEAYHGLEVGGVLINQVPTYRVENMPYGGVKESGFGREGVAWAMEEMTEPKTLIVNVGAP